MSAKKKIVFIAVPVILIIAIGGFIGVAGKSADLEKIKSDPVQTMGTIVKSDNLTEYNTNGCWIYYEYSVEGKTYKHCQKYHGWKKEDKYFLGATFPIVYCRKDPDLSRLLIIEDEFREFNFVQPDSLKKYNGRIL